MNGTGLEILDYDGPNYKAVVRGTEMKRPATEYAFPSRPTDWP